MTAETTIRAQLRPAHDRVRILAPAPGRCVLMCACGRALDLAGMRRKKRRPTQDRMTIQPIVCSECTS